MDTATISYRVADFLKKYPPFQAMDDVDVLAVAGRGRVRFHERNEHILSEGEAHRHEVFVIQQGVVSLWSESNGAFELRDVRGPGDLLGVERFNGASSTLHSARAATDVVIYALPAGDIETLREIANDPHAFLARQGWTDLDLAEERELAQLQRLHASRTVVTIRHDGTVTIDFAPTPGQFAQGDQPSSIDVREIPLPWLPHIDQKGRCA